MAEKPKELKREVHKFGAEEIEVIFRKAIPIEEADKGMPPLWFPPLQPGVITEDGIRCERDVPVKLRDGTHIRVDIYRPEGATNVPAIIAWSPYGKRGGEAPWGTLDKAAHAVPIGAMSPMAKFECPDPAYWCHYGYAIINPDPRGVGCSEGDVVFTGTKEGQDAYDLIEWVAAQQWCSGKVAMEGNSWVGWIQWYTAAERPPHLACIAPWEGASDMYREYATRDGVPEIGISEFVYNLIAGPRGQEDGIAMVQKYPLMNAYWEDKIAKVENIEIPAFVQASYTSPFHTRGTFEAFKRMPGTRKWLRVHNTQEWTENYKPSNLRDLRDFFDRYLKGIRNGWEYTPTVRLSVLDPGNVDIVDRPENEWPLARTQYQKLYLDAESKKLSPDPMKQESSVRYDAQTGEAVFTMKFDKDTELTGHTKLRLWVEADGSDDMDLFVRIGKLDAQGNPLDPLTCGTPESGFPGALRVSHRELDEERSTPQQPYHTHRREELLKPKEIVPVDIEIWPMGMLWHAGEQLRVYVGGHDLSGGICKALGEKYWAFATRNKGGHIIHTGGKYDSHILVPVIPPK